METYDALTVASELVLPLALSLLLLLQLVVLVVLYLVLATLHACTTVREAMSELSSHPGMAYRDGPPCQSTSQL